VGEAVGQALPYAVAIAVSPIPIVGVVLMLATPAGPREAAAFLVGWVGSLALAGAALLVLASGGSASSDGAPATWVSLAKIALGAALLHLAVRKWKERPRPGEQPEPPSWMQAIDSFTPVRAAALGAALAVVNPKNLLLLVAGAAAIAQTGASSGDQAAALAVFIVVATVGVAVPVAIKSLMGERANALLAEMHEWLVRENSTILSVILLVIAAKLFGDAIAALSG
jgi:hypothetical protein